MGKGVHRVSKTIGFTIELLEELDWMADDSNPNKKFINLRDAVTKLIGIGLIIIKQEGKIESGELVEQLNGLIKDEKMMTWIQNLSSGQRIGLKQMITLLEEQEQKKIL